MPDSLRPSPDETLAAWAARVRANREQVDRFREVPDPGDFYAPVTSLFRADPRRAGEPTLEALRSLPIPGETWLDIGAGAGRYALPLALIVGEVIAVEPSAGMIAALRELMSEYEIRNVRIVHERWPLEPPQAEPLRADVALIAHLGYDIEAIGPFLDAMEGSARRLCVAVLTERQPSSIADPFWPPVHGEERVPLPALPEFLSLLIARGRIFEVRLVERAPRTFETEEQLANFLRRQPWIEEGGEKDRRFRAVLAERTVRRADGYLLADQPPLPIGVVTWSPG